MKFQSALVAFASVAVADIDPIKRLDTLVRILSRSITVEHHLEHHSKQKTCDFRLRFEKYVVKPVVYNFSSNLEEFCISDE